MRLHPAILLLFITLLLFRRPAEAAFDSAGKRVDARRSGRTAGGPEQPASRAGRLGRKIRRRRWSGCRSGGRRWCGCRRRGSRRRWRRRRRTVRLSAPRKGMPLPLLAVQTRRTTHLAGAVAARDGVRKRYFDLAFFEIPAGAGMIALAGAGNVNDRVAARRQRRRNQDKDREEEAEELFHSSFTAGSNIAKPAE